MNELARDPKQIGNVIRRARKRLGWSQKALGDKAGLRQETISLLENGNPSAKIETIEQQLPPGFPEEIHRSVKAAMIKRLPRVSE